MISCLWGRIPGSDRPIPASQAPGGQWINCWFCGARIRQRKASGKITHYVTHRGDEHHHFLCQRLADSKKILNTENAAELFWKAMAKDPIPSANDSDAGGSNPPTNEETEVYLKSLADLVYFGLFLCPDFNLSNEDRLSDIMINSSIATDYFSDGPIDNLGYRAIVVKPQTFNDAKKWIRYVLDYQAHDGTAKKMYFYQTTTVDAIYNELKQKIFCKSADGQGYVAKNYPAVIIYGAWIANECSWCKLTDKNPGCMSECGCSNYQYESTYTTRKFLYPINDKMMSHIDVR